MSIYLRAADGSKRKPGDRSNIHVHECIPGSAMRAFPRSLEFCEAAAAYMRGILARVSLVALKPGTQVYPHYDHGDYYLVRDRYHLVVKSDSGSPLTAGQDCMVMREGELWCFNNKACHAAFNPSAGLRVHLIFDIEPSDPERGFYTFELTSEEGT